VAESIPKFPLSELAALPLFPLPSAVLFPGALMPLHVFEPRYRALARDVLAGGKLLAVARLRAGFEADYEGRPPIDPICGVGQVVEHELRSDGRYDLMLLGLGRVRIDAELPPDRPYRLARATLLEDEPQDLAAMTAWQREFVTSWGRLAPYLPSSIRDLCRERSSDETCGDFADRVAAAIVSDPDERQRLIEELDPSERLARLVTRVHELFAALGTGQGTPGSQPN
jgi:hypothetical protein